MMTPNDDLITRLMLKYARREKLTDEEMRILEEWWKLSPEHQQLAEQFGDEDWVRAQLSKMKPAPMKEMWEGINKYLDAIGAPDDRANPDQWEDPAPPAIHRRPWLKYAAAAAVIIGAASIYLLVTNNHPKTAVAATPKTQPVANDNDALLIAADGSSRTLDNELYTVDEKTNPAGAQTVLVGKKHTPFTVRLPDGSNVFLAAGAQFEYQTDNHAIANNYHLRGKAFFDVTKNKSRPFIVHTPHDRNIDVLGTAFNVDATDTQTLVGLLNGAASVSNGTENKILQPGEEATMTTNNTDVHRMTNSAAATAWVKQTLYFHFSNTDFLAAITSVATWYGYTVSNPKGLKGIPITDNLRKELSPEEVVFNIGQIESGYLYISISDKVIHISDKKTAIDR